MTTQSWQVHRSAEAIRGYHEGLPEAEQQALIWRLANQSLVSDIIIELHNAGYADMDLGASVRATSCTFYLDERPALLRVLVRVGVFVSGPAPSGHEQGADEEPLQIAAVEVGIVLQLPCATPDAAADAADGEVGAGEARSGEVEVPLQTGKASAGGGSDGDTTHETTTTAAECGDTTAAGGDTTATQGVVVTAEGGAAAPCAEAAGAEAAGAEAAADGEKTARTAAARPAKGRPSRAEAEAAARAAEEQALAKAAGKREPAGRLKYSLRPAPSQPVVSRQQLLGAARILALRCDSWLKERRLCPAGGCQGADRSYPPQSACLSKA